MVSRGSGVFVHEQAIVEDGAVLADDVYVGPFCIVGRDVSLGEGVRLVSHVSVTGDTTIGAGTCVFPFGTIGFPPQDLKYAGEDSKVVIGENNQIRESVTIHRGTAGGRMETTIGNDNMIMHETHIAHDCIVGDSCVLGARCAMSGHVEIGDQAVLGGMVSLHQFCKVGEHSFIGATSAIHRSIVPYGYVFPRPLPYLRGINIRALRKRGFHQHVINSLLKAYKMIFEEEGAAEGKPFLERTEHALETFRDIQEVVRLTDFILMESREKGSVLRGVLKGSDWEMRSLVAFRTFDDSVGGTE
jgi:UDP-N-acetylglucosamine acyltransferase